MTQFVPRGTICHFGLGFQFVPRGTKSALAQFGRSFNFKPPPAHETFPPKFAKVHGSFPPFAPLSAPQTTSASPARNPFPLNHLTVCNHSTPRTLSTALLRSPQRKSLHPNRPSLYSGLPWERF